MLALVSLSIVTAGGYFLFTHMPAALAPPSSLAIAHAMANDLTTRLSASIAAVSPADAPDPAAVSAFIASRAEGSAPNTPSTSNAMAMAPADAENAPPTGSIEADQGADNASASHVPDAAMLAIAEANAAPGDPEHVAQLNQTFTAPYVDRGILFFREKKDDHGFPDLPPLKHAERPGHPKSLLAAGGKGHEVLPKVVPLPVPRTALHYVQQRRQQQPWYASAGFQ